ncbi:helix-turn-helix domain-containing protein [Myxococcota bacterium]|nr:helix-turn-helix domain-containing protein [Myxococcota bacterium]
MLGEQLRAARLAARWSQEKLAEKAGISRNYVSLLELNRKSPTVDVLLAICGALDVSAAEIIGAVERTGRSRRRRG